MMVETPQYPSRPAQTEDLIRRLTGSNCDPKEKRALEALAMSMIRIFQNHTELQASNWRLPTPSSTAAPDGNILDPKLLTSFAYVPRRAPSTLSAETAKLGSVLDRLQKRLEKAGRQAEVET
ncbi:hypothetical protein VTN00DRAFT_2914 [Thermoascus crustaceus]|uniref:uncharacterized protein n=1 Tax=Thermoascus crustaceus TaxID=5088 RepID=UPI003743C612